ncbi:hypothetical protein Tco_0661829, partial [Tanacetum coccineum]
VTIPKTNTPYPSRKIRRICACTHQRPHRNKAQYAAFKIKYVNILEDIKHSPYSKQSLIRRDLDNSTSNVLIPLDSWTSGLLVYKLPLSDEGEGKIVLWEELVEKFFCKFYLDSYDGEDEMLDGGDNWGIDPLKFLSRVNSSFDKHMKIDGRTKKVLFHAWMNGNWNKRRIDNNILSSKNTTSDSFFIPNLKTHEKSSTEKEEEQSQTKRKYINTSVLLMSNPTKEGAKQKSLKLFSTHLDKKDEGWKVTRTGNEYQEKDKNKTKTGQIRARDWKERKKSEKRPKPKAYNGPNEPVNI